MFFVVWGHVYMIAMTSQFNTNLFTAMPHIMKPFWFPLLPGAVFAVDVFFWLSGFLTFFLLTGKLSQMVGN